MWLSFVGCHLCQFKISTLGWGFHDLSLSHIFVPRFGMSAWRLKCTKHMGRISDVVQ